MLWRTSNRHSNYGISTFRTDINSEGWTLRTQQVEWKFFGGYFSSGGGIRTPDTWIMIPLL